MYVEFIIGVSICVLLEDYMCDIGGLFETDIVFVCVSLRIDNCKGIGGAQVMLILSKGVSESITTIDDLVSTKLLLIVGLYKLAFRSVDAVVIL